MEKQDPKACRWFSVYENGAAVTMVCAKHRSICPRCTETSCPDFTPKKKMDEMKETKKNPADGHFPDELLERIIAKLEAIALKDANVKEFAEMTEEEVAAAVWIMAKSMVMGAKVALDYVREKPAGA